MFECADSTTFNIKFLLNLFNNALVNIFLSIINLINTLFLMLFSTFILLIDKINI